MSKPLNIGLTRSQSDDLMVKTMMVAPFLAASWRGGEPIVYGFGKSAWAAQNMARQSGAPNDFEICPRLVAANVAWRGPSGREITLEHVLTIDD